MQGMSTLIPNSLQYPNFYVDELMCLLTPEENTVLMFAARQILGWDDTRGTRKARIALSVFVDGYRSETGFENHGTGLSEPTIKKCLSVLCDVGVLVKNDTNNDGTEYSINFNRDSVNLYALSKRKQERDENERRRHEKAVSAMHSKRGIIPKSPTVLSDTPPAVLSDTPPAVLSDTPPAVLSDSTIKQNKQIETKGDSKNESLPSGEPKEDTPIVKEHKERIRAILGDPEMGQHGAVASPRQAEREYVKAIAPMFAVVLGRVDGMPITEDEQAARRAFKKNLAPGFIEQRVRAYRNGEGDDFRKPEATAFWIVNRLEKDRAMVPRRTIIKVVE